MNMDKTQITNMSSRQKALVGSIILIVIIIIWLGLGLFKRNPKPVSAALPNKNVAAVNAGSVPSMQPNTPQSVQSNTPQPAQLNQQPVSTPQQSDLAKMQQETQQKYIVALNELQMLKLSQQIAETNKDIAAAKLATVTAEKGIIDLLTKPVPPVETPASFPGLANPAAPPPGGPPAAISVVTVTTTNYIVISVSKLLNRWSAVLGYQGTLYSVYLGDVLPPDQSVVIDINKSGVILEKDGIRRKVSLVPII